MSGQIWNSPFSSIYHIEPNNCPVHTTPNSILSTENSADQDQLASHPADLDPLCFYPHNEFMLNQ